MKVVVLFVRFWLVFLLVEFSCVCCSMILE